MAFAVEMLDVGYFVIYGAVGGLGEFSVLVHSFREIIYKHLPRQPFCSFALQP
jgi:hypothetical protein